MSRMTRSLSLPSVAGSGAASGFAGGRGEQSEPFGAGLGGNMAEKMTSAEKEDAQLFWQQTLRRGLGNTADSPPPAEAPPGLQRRPVGTWSSHVESSQQQRRLRTGGTSVVSSTIGPSASVAAWFVQMKCRRCAALPLSAEARFCWRCGAVLPAGEPSELSTAKPLMPPPPARAGSAAARGDPRSRGLAAPRVDVVVAGFGGEVLEGGGGAPSAGRSAFRGGLGSAPRQAFLPGALPGLGVSLAAPNPGGAGGRSGFARKMPEPVDSLGGGPLEPSRMKSACSASSLQRKEPPEEVPTGGQLLNPNAASQRPSSSVPSAAPLLPQSGPRRAGIQGLGSSAGGAAGPGSALAPLNRDAGGGAAGARGGVDPSTQRGGSKAAPGSGGAVVPAKVSRRIGAPMRWLAKENNLAQWMATIQPRGSTLSAEALSRKS